MPTLNSYLKKVLVTDAVVSGAAGLAMIGGAGLTAGLLGLPAELLMWSGVALVPFVATLGLVIRAGAAPAGVIVAISAINFAWVAASLFVAYGPAFAPTLLGKVFVTAQAAMVLVFGELQWIGLRRRTTA